MAAPGQFTWQQFIGFLDALSKTERMEKQTSICWQRWWFMEALAAGRHACCYWFHHNSAIAKDASKIKLLEITTGETNDIWNQNFGHKGGTPWGLSLWMFQVPTTIFLIIYCWHPLSKMQIYEQSISILEVLGRCTWANMQLMSLS
jgi:hypothetical protein